MPAQCGRITIKEQYDAFQQAAFGGVRRFLDWAGYRLVASSVVVVVAGRAADWRRGGVSAAPSHGSYGRGCAGWAVGRRSSAIVHAALHLARRAVPGRRERADARP